jgi:Uma2 family endonuclease
MIRKTIRATLPQFDSMVRDGVFENHVGKIELLRGEILEVNPASPVHDDYVTYLNNWSASNCDPSKTLVTSQTGMDLPEADSRPEPDVFWIRKNRYRLRHPITRFHPPCKPLKHHSYLPTTHSFVSKSTVCVCRLFSFFPPLSLISATVLLSCQN